MNIIRTICISLLCLLPLSGVLSQESKQVNTCSSDDTEQNTLSSLEALEPWFTREQYQNLEQYHQRIKQLETEQGVYHDAIAPTLISLGLLQHESGESVLAKKHYERALHIIRINHGLYSPKQLPVLELLIEANKASNEWKAATDNHDHIYWLYKRNFKTSDARFLPVVKRLRRWHIDVYNRDTGRSLSQHFRVAEGAYDHAIRIIEQCTGERRQALCFWHEGCCPGQTGYCPEKH